MFLLESPFQETETGEPSASTATAKKPFYPICEIIVGIISHNIQNKVFCHSILEELVTNQANKWLQNPRPLLLPRQHLQESKLNQQQHRLHAKYPLMIADFEIKDKNKKYY